MGVAEHQDYHYYASYAASASSSKKRKAQGSVHADYGNKQVIDLTGDTPPKKRKKQPANEEKRLRRWRNHPPGSYLEIRERALTQRMCVLDRQRDTSSADHPIESISLAGTTGNIYTITIDKEPSCDCPHAIKGNQCKHIIYVLARVLRVSEDLVYQLAFVSSELRDIFARAPPLPSEQGDDAKKDGNRKAIEGECPICCEDFDPGNSSEAVVYCKTSCGNNVHKKCFQQWAAMKKGSEVTCPFCRTPWESDEGQSLKNIASRGLVNEDGYINVAGQLGISGQRDYSTYNPYWVRRRRTFGYDQACPTFRRGFESMR